MAGPKGSGLSLMIEVLVSVLGGNPRISGALLEKRDAGFNGLVMAIDPQAFGPEGTKTKSDGSPMRSGPCRPHGMRSRFDCRENVDMKSRRNGLPAAS
jgi:hypothetical protein